MMKRTLYVLFAVTLLLFSSCSKKELDYDQPHTVNLKVVFDWKNAPDAKHETMSLYLFPTVGGKSLRYEFTNMQGGTIEVPVGSYTSLCLNSDTESILFRGTDSYDTFEVYTRDASLLEGIGVRSNNAPRAKGTEEERVAAAPDIIDSDRTGEFTLSGSDTEQALVLHPQMLVGRVTYEIKNAENLEGIISLGGSISGMAGGLLLAKNEPTADHVTTPFEVVSDGISNVSGNFTTFCYCPSVEYKHVLTMYAVLSDGSKWYYTYDVTNQIHSASDMRDVHIILDGLPLPKLVVNGGGFQPDVDDWRDVNVDIGM